MYVHHPLPLPPLKTNFTPEIDVPKIIFLSSLEVLKRSPEEEFYKMKKSKKYWYCAPIISLLAISITYWLSRRWSGWYWSLPAHAWGEASILSQLFLHRPLAFFLIMCDPQEAPSISMKCDGWSRMECSGWSHLGLSHSPTAAASRGEKRLSRSRDTYKST